MNNPCIYIYNNKENDKSYVGLTINLEHRKLQHKLGKQYIDRAIRKYGENQFDIYMVECDANIIDFMERYYIKWMQSKFPLGYNLADGGVGGSHNHLHRKVLCIDTGEVFNGIREAARALDLKHNHIINCCKGKKKSTGGLRWRYYED